MLKLQTTSLRIKTDKSRLKIFNPQENSARSKFGESSHKRGYNYWWRVERAKFLAENPLCVFCREKGVIKAATVVDHIRRHGGNRDLFRDKNNWQSLCAHCHNAVKQQQESK